MYYIANKTIKEFFLLHFTSKYLTFLDTAAVECDNHASSLKLDVRLTDGAFSKAQLLIMSENLSTDQINLV